MLPKLRSWLPYKLAPRPIRKAVWAVTLLVPFGLALMPGFGFNNYTYTLLNFGLIYSIVTLSLHLLTGWAGQISLGHSGLLAIGAYLCGVLVSERNLPFWLSLPLAALLTGLLGAVLALPALRLTGPYLAILTVGFTVAVPQLLKFINFRTDDGLEGLKIDLPNWPGVAADSDLVRYYWLLLITIAVYWLCGWLTRSRIGRGWQALRDSEMAAQAVGINLARYKVLAFAISAALTGLAGGLYLGQLGRVEADQFTLLQSISFVVMLVVGGIRSRAGVVVGAIVMTLAPELVNRLSQFLQDHFSVVQFRNPEYVLYGLLMIVIVRFAPDGLAGLWRKWRPLRQPDPPTEAKKLAFPLPRPHKTFRLENLTVRFGGLTALENVNLEARPGEIIGIIGPNGAGKSTLFNLISRFYRPTSGSIRWGDTDLTRLRPSALNRLGIARTFQNVELFKSGTVLDQLLLAQPGQPTKAATLQSLAILDFLGLLPITYQPVTTLSFGTQKLVELARALVSQPRLLLLDEPAAGTSASETRPLGQLIRQIRQEFGTTILLVEHDMDLVMEVCDRLYVLNFGKLIASGTPAEVQQDPAVIEAYLGEPLTNSEPDSEIDTEDNQEGFWPNAKNLSKGEKNS